MSTASVLQFNSDGVLELIEPRIFDDWDEAYEYFNGDRHLRVERTLQAI